MAVCIYVVQHARLQSQTTADVADVHLLPSQASLGQVPHNSTTNTYLLCMVVEPTQCNQRSSVCNPMVPGVRCLGLGVGSPSWSLRTRGLWSQQKLLLNIKVRELRTIHLACEIFLPQLSGKVVQALSTNMGERGHWTSAQKPLACETSVSNTLSIWKPCFPEVRNTLADRLSRSFFSHRKWSLHLEVIRTIFQRWGTPQMDPLTTRQNRKCYQFSSLPGLDSGSLSNAFLLSWAGDLMYTFPPIPLISKVLLKIKTD